jgi:hypothetical protein
LLFQSVGFIILYVGLVLQIVSKAFSLIHVIPDRVLRWIGGGGESLGESDFESRVENIGKSGGNSLMMIVNTSKRARA